jgi:hypothetical protein
MILFFVLLLKTLHNLLKEHLFCVKKNVVKKKNYMVFSFIITFFIT